MSFVGGLSDGFAGEGLSDGDALGNECGDAFDEWNGNFRLGSGFGISSIIHPTYHMAGKWNGSQQLYLTPFDTLGGIYDFGFTIYAGDRDRMTVRVVVAFTRADVSQKAEKYEGEAVPFAIVDCRMWNVNATRKSVSYFSHRNDEISGIEGRPHAFEGPPWAKFPIPYRPFAICRAVAVRDHKWRHHRKFSLQSSFSLFDQGLLPMS
jgi:hypothetical protein